METFTKAEFARLLKEKLGFSSLICEEITNSIFCEILQLALAGKKLVLPNFGRFQVHYKSSRPAVNLRTGAAMEIGPRAVLRFHPCRLFREKVNSHAANQ